MYGDIDCKPSLKIEYYKNTTAINMYSSMIHTQFCYPCLSTIFFFLFKSVYMHENQLISIFTWFYDINTSDSCNFV